MPRKTPNLYDILYSLNVRYPALEDNRPLPLGTHYFAFPTSMPYHTNKWPIRLKLVWHVDGAGPAQHTFGESFVIIFSSGGHAHRLKWTPHDGWEVCMQYNATHDGANRWLDANDTQKLVFNPLFPPDKCRKARAVMLHILRRAEAQKKKRRPKKAPLYKGKAA